MGKLLAIARLTVRAMTRVAYFAVATAALSGMGQASVLRVQNARVATVDVLVNGHLLKLRVDPAANGDVTLNPDAASRARLRPSAIPVVGLIGPVKVRGKWAKSRIRVGTASGKAIFTWYDRPITNGADGIISPGILPFEEVHLRLGPTGKGENTAVIPVHFSKDYGVAQLQSVAGFPVRVRFSIGPRNSISTAAAGATLSGQHGGSWSGSASQTLMKLGVERPTRPLRLSRPWHAGPFSISDFAVRTGDWRGNHSLPSDAPQDPGEIVVVARSRGSQKPVYEFVVGHDQIGTCSLIIYSRARQSLQFTC